MKAAHAIVTGVVQGVGFRAFVEREARMRGLDGWVRNRRDGSVETVIAGDEVAVDAMIAALQVGPRASEVSSVKVEAHGGGISGGFVVLPTA